MAMMTTFPPSAGPSPRRRQAILDAVGWLVFAAAAVFVVLWLAPRKGVDFADEGWYLQAALAFVHGQGFDSMLPQAPFYVINAAFMRLGLEGYLGQRLLYFGLIGLSLFLLAAGLSRDRGRGFPAPLAMAAGLLAVLTSVLSYENGPVLFGSAALGLCFLAARALRSGVRAVLAILAGASLSLSVFINFTTLPAALCCAGVFFLAQGEKKNPLTALASFVLIFVALAAWYVSAIGLDEFFRIPSESHGFKFAKVPVLLEYALQWPVFFLAVFAVLWIILRRRACSVRTRALVVRILTLLVCLIFFLFMARRTGVFDLASPFVPLFAFPKAAGLSWIGSLPDLLQFQLVLFLGFALASLALVGTLEKNREYAVYAGTVCCIGAFWLVQVFFSESAPSLRAFYAGPLLAAALPRLLAFSRGQARESRFADISVFSSGLLVIACCLMYALSYTHPGAGIPGQERIALRTERLEGIFETPERAELLARLAEVYEENGCADKSFFTFKFSNLLHYLFDKKAPPGLSYILPVRRYPETRIMEELESGGKWCVFITKNNGLDASWDKTENIVNFLEERSARIVRLGRTPKRHLYDDFTVYVGPK